MAKIMLKGKDYSAPTVGGGAAETAGKWETARSINGMLVDGSADRANYGDCNSAAGSAVKNVSCPGFALTEGAEVTVHFTNGNTAVGPMLSVNGTAAKEMWNYCMPMGDIMEDSICTFRYSWGVWKLVNGGSSNAGAASKWTTPRNINGMLVDGSGDRTNYGVVSSCDTSRGMLRFVVDCDGFEVTEGAEIAVMFTGIPGNDTYSLAALNVNGTGYWYIYFGGAQGGARGLRNNCIYTFRYVKTAGSGGYGWHFVSSYSDAFVNELRNEISDLKNRVEILEGK